MKLAIVTLVLLMSASVARAGCVVGFTVTNADEAALIAAENAWCEAAVARNREGLDAVIADDVSWIEDVGYRDKAAVLQRYLAEVEEHEWTQTDVRIRVVGDMAVVQSHIHVRKRVAGREEDSSHPSVDVFQRRGGRWQLVAE